MKFAVVFLLLVSSLVIFWVSFSIFFAQDDFILINQFSQNDLVTNVKNTFGKPVVTHWRPMHNLYFLIGGSIFGKHYQFYHGLLLAILISASFFVYLVLKKISQSEKIAIISSFIYALQPSHFMSVFWITGGATSLGFLFFISSFHFFLKGRRGMSIFLYALSLLASEAMVVASLIFIFYTFIFKKLKAEKDFLVLILGLSIFFLIIKFLFLTSRATYDVYEIKISYQIFDTFKYYLLRIFGFADASKPSSLVLLSLAWLVLALMPLFLKFRGEKKLVKFFSTNLLIGLFPFILIPNHTSPHYMNVSIWSFAVILALGLKNYNPKIIIFLLMTYFITSYISIGLVYKNNWVTKRSNISRIYLSQIESLNPPNRSVLTFRDNQISTSEEAYYSLGAGEAIRFWFSDKNYKTCFTFFENCLNNQK